MIPRLKFASANFIHPLKKGVATPSFAKDLIGVAIVLAQKKFLQMFSFAASVRSQMFLPYPAAHTA